MILYSVCYFVLDEADKACDIDIENQIRTVSFITLPFLLL